MPLISICEARNIDWDYDIITKVMALSRDSQRVSLAVGSSVVIVNGIPRDIKYPVELYKGAVVIPVELKEEVFDGLFKGTCAITKETLAAPGYAKKVVIDPGHGGRDPGAIGRSGLKEKDAVLDISKRLARILKEAGYEVILTRDNDTFIPLASRSRIANEAGADIFLSIHANANRVRSLSGFEVYYVSQDVSDVDRALVTAENTDLEPRGTVIAAESLDLKATVWDMIYTSNRAESIDLARYLCSNARACLPARIIGVKGAPFHVLRSTQMPSVLVEVGFVSNSKEEKMLNNSFYRQEIAEAIAQGVKEYSRDYTVMEAGINK
jgi:N-acetylmuramoyl-L-alanine amidase